MSKLSRLVQLTFQMVHLKTAQAICLVKVVVPVVAFRQLQTTTNNE